MTFTKEELLGSCVKWAGIHKGITYNISCMIREPSPYLDYDKAWATYVILNPEQHEKYMAIINDAPWNGGQTYYRKHTDEYLGISQDLKLKRDGHYFKIGDDFQHIWDYGMHAVYDLDYMRRHIIEVIDYLEAIGDILGVRPVTLERMMR